MGSLKSSLCCVSQCLSALLSCQRDQPVRARYLFAIQPYLAFDFIMAASAAL